MLGFSKMKEIIINTSYKKIQYWISWVLFILFGMLWAWIVAIGLYSYGKDTPENKTKKKGILNMSYQKFIYWYGLIVTYILLLGIILSLLSFF